MASASSSEKCRVRDEIREFVESLPESLQK